MAMMSSGSALSHDIGADRSVRDLRTHVDRARHSIERIEVLGKALPLPVDPLGKCSSWDVLDAFHQLDQEVLLSRPNRRKADPAVAHDDGRDTVPAGGRQVRVPGDLSVVVSMNVDPARRHEKTLCIDLASSPTELAPDRNDQCAVDRNVGPSRWRSGSIDEHSTANEEVVHGLLRSNSAGSGECNEQQEYQSWG